MTNSGSAVEPARVVILGAQSAIAEAAAREWAREKAHLILCARDAEKLKAIASDLQLRGATVATYTTDLVNTDIRQSFGKIFARMERIDVVLLAYGVLGDQALAEKDPDEAQRILETNFTSAAAWCLAAAMFLDQQQHGTLIVLGSVAGDRGRASNYVYGAAKGGLGILVQGIAHRLAKTGARAVLVKSGFVDTPMTAHFTRKGLLWAKPDAIARAIVKVGRCGNRSRTIIYVPGFWRWIMYVIRFAPSFVFHRSKL